MNTYRRSDLKYIDDIKVETISSEIQYLNINESMNDTNLIASIKNINQNYKTKNDGKLEEISNELNNTFKTIKNNHQNNLLVLQKTIENYRDLSNSISVKFDNI